MAIVTNLDDARGKLPPKPVDRDTALLAIRQLERRGHACTYEMLRALLTAVASVAHDLGTSEIEEAAENPGTHALRSKAAASCCWIERRAIDLLGHVEEGEKASEDAYSAGYRHLPNRNVQ